MEWEEFIEDCERDRKITILSYHRFRKMFGKPERVYVEKLRIHCEYGIIGGQIVNRDFTDKLLYQTIIYWLKDKLPVRKGRKNSLTVVYHCCPKVVLNPIIWE